MPDPVLENRPIVFHPARTRGDNSCVSHSLYAAHRKNDGRRHRTVPWSAQYRGGSEDHAKVHDRWRTERAHRVGAALSLCSGDDGHDDELQSGQCGSGRADDDIEVVPLSEERRGLCHGTLRSRLAEAMPTPMARTSYRYARASLFGGRERGVGAEHTGNFVDTRVKLRDGEGLGEEARRVRPCSHALPILSPHPPPPHPHLRTIQA